MIIAGTGHRPPKLGGYDANTRRALGALAVEYLFDHQPDRVISGMALGWDQALAAAAIVQGIPLVAAIPFQEHGSNWPKPARDRYFRILERADEHVVTWPQPVGPTFNVNRAMQRRNEWMVDRADKLVALWDGSWGGTFNCIEYARKKGVPFDNLWARWSTDDAFADLLGY